MKTYTFFAFLCLTASTGLPETHVTETLAEGRKAIVLENDKVKLTILPELGSKITSLVYKPTGREFLWQQPGFEPVLREYDAPYTDYNMTGFDECFPTVGRCHYPGGAWDGVVVPDHGEVWTLPFDYEIEGETVRLSVRGVRFPYLFEKAVSLSKATVRIDYRVSNSSSEKLLAIWAAHPLLAVEPGMKILLPADTRVRVDGSKGGRLGHQGNQHNWPVTTDSSGRTVDLSVLLRPDAGLADKLFTFPLKDGWCAVQDPGTREYIAYTFPTNVVPCVGLWINQGGWGPDPEHPFYHVALEPTTGAPDRLDIAAGWGEAPTIPAKGVVEWSLEVHVGQGADEIHGEDLR